ELLQVCVVAQPEVLLGETSLPELDADRQMGDVGDRVNDMAFWREAPHRSADRVAWPLQVLEDVREHDDVELVRVESLPGERVQIGGDDLLEASLARFLCIRIVEIDAHYPGQPHVLQGLA